MGATLLAFLLGASPRAAASGSASADLTAQLPSVCSNQGDVGACHAFASVELLQAAIKRRRGREVFLSSADLFTRVALKNNDYKIEERKDGKAEVVQVEAGFPEKDLEAALDDGVAFAETAPWSAFIQSYQKERDERRARSEALCLEAGKDRDCRDDKLEDFIDELEDSADARERRLLGASPKLATDRVEVKGLLSGLTLESARTGPLRTFGAATAQDVADAAVCREKGAKQTEVLKERLDAGLPLVVCFKMDNVPGWDGDMAKKSGASHCVLVYGYETVGAGSQARKSFKIRNSWGGAASFAYDPVNGSVKAAFVENTHDIDEDHACTIRSAFWLTP